MMQSEKALMRAVSRIDEKNSKHSFPPSAALVEAERPLRQAQGVWTVTRNITRTGSI